MQEVLNGLAELAEDMDSARFRKGSPLCVEKCRCVLRRARRCLVTSLIKMSLVRATCDGKGGRGKHNRQNPES